MARGSSVLARSLQDVLKVSHQETVKACAESIYRLSL